MVCSFRPGSGSAADATSKCLICSRTFGSAQDFYEHLDDYVLCIPQQEKPSEAINTHRLAEVEQDQAVNETLRKNGLLITTSNRNVADADEDKGEIDNEKDDDLTLRALPIPKGRGSQNPTNGVRKSRGRIHY
jgi:hypothetical protein